jgi:hypothetical protein
MGLAGFTDAAARASNCWFDVDRVSGDPATTTWKRRARLHQASWREARGHPIGAEPYEGGDRATTVGSRLALDFALKSCANFLTANIIEAVRVRLAIPERHHMLKETRLWADLLSSMPLCFNLFGELYGNAERAAQAVGLLWPDAPRGHVNLRFEHSPGRRDPALLGNRTAFDMAFEIDASVAERGIIGVETKYHEHAAIEPAPRPDRLALCRGHRTFLGIRPNLA